jgi:hypothetical protein
MTNRTYSEMNERQTFEDRYEYLRLDGRVGVATFGFDRHINQKFYRSHEWKQVREFVITRDNGCDLGVIGYEINHALLIHHMNPMQLMHIMQGDDSIIDPDNLITTTQRTHNAIHYGDASLLPKAVVSRQRGDTKLW